MNYSRQEEQYYPRQRGQTDQYYDYPPQPYEQTNAGYEGYDEPQEEYMSEDEQNQFFQDLHDNLEETHELVKKQHKVITIFAIAIIFIGILAGYALLMMDSNATYHANATNNMVFLVNQTLISNGVTGLTREQILNGEGET